jgi:soluble cytochrome b562
MSGPTPFLETNALLAAQEGQLDEAWRLVQEMYPNERRRLAEACDELSALCQRGPVEKVKTVAELLDDLDSMEDLQ